MTSDLVQFLIFIVFDFFLIIFKSTSLESNFISLMVKKTRTKTVEVEPDESDDDKPKLEELDEKNQDDKVKDEDGKVEDEDGKVEDEEDDEEKKPKTNISKRF